MRWSKKLLLLPLLGIPAAALAAQYGPRIGLDIDNKTINVAISAPASSLGKPDMNFDTSSPIEQAAQKVMESYIAEKKPFILIDKSDRQLTLFEEGNVKYSVPVSFGGNNGDKVREGDKATPVGEFYVCTINPNSRYEKFFGLSYPNIEDATRGLESKLISQKEHNSIVSAIQNRKQPSWTTKLGGAIGIHGPIQQRRTFSLGKTTYTLNVILGSYRDATHGCISTDSNHLDKLKKSVGYNTPVIIKK